MTEAEPDEVRVKRVERCFEEFGAIAAKVRGMGPNGPEILGLEGEWSIAFRVLRKAMDGDVLGVFLNNATSYAIDFHWGWTTDEPKSKGQGLAKLLRWHPDVVADIDQIIALAVVVSTPARTDLFYLMVSI